MNPIRVRIFYPADPVGVVPGGIDTFIRGLIKWAPDDLEFSLVGMTTDPRQRPPGRWTQQVLGSRVFDCFPAVAVPDAGQRSRVPLSLSYTLAVRRQREVLARGFDIFDFHRPEPSLLFQADRRPKVAYFHQDPEVVALGASDMVWKHLPDTYRRLEGQAAALFDRLWCVRESGVLTLKKRYPKQAGQIGFIPTWVDHEVFHPVRDEAERHAGRWRQARSLQIDPQAQWIVSVGRLDTQKDPALMLDAFTRLCRADANAWWLVVGDGRLRAELERDARAAGVAERIRFLGLQPAAAIAELLRVADLFALSSAYEGMPMAALEALGCGLPVVSTDVGEVRRVVFNGVNGWVVEGREPQAFALALARGLRHAPLWRGEPAVAATRDYRPAGVLAGAYAAYRELGAPMRQLRENVHAQATASPPERERLDVIGVPIDVGPSDAALARILRWGQRHESRYTCFCNVHSVVEARRDPRHHLVVEGADLAAPDGAPVAWSLGWKLGHKQERVDGPGSMWTLCGHAERLGLKIGLYGATQKTLDALRARLLRHFPQLHIAYVYSPPFRTLSAEEDAAICDAVTRAGVHLLFVGLGCPKQERWMAEHRGRIPAVMLGVGAAFDFHAGLVSRAPGWMRRAGLEWAHRLGQDPRRLAKRYAVTNSRFVVWSAADAARSRHPDRDTAAAGRSRSASRPGASRSARPDARPDRPPTSGARAHRRDPVRIDLAAVDELVARIDAQLSPRSSRVIEFVASARGEGTTSIASAFAAAHADQWQRRVLLLGVPEHRVSAPGLLDALAEGSLKDAPIISQRADGVYTATLGPLESRHRAWGQVHRDDLWASLRQQFDLVVLDMPATEVSRTALTVAGKADGVVVVVEAERARAPVVRDLVHRLQAVRANVLGTVMNKRRYHLPGALYRWL